MKAKDIMTTKLFTLKADHKLDLASDVMDWQRIRHVPIVDDSHNLEGLLTHRDLLNASISSLAKMTDKEQREIHEQIPVSTIMKTNMITVSPEDDFKACRCPND